MVDAFPYLKSAKLSFRIENVSQLDIPTSPHWSYCISMRPKAVAVNTLPKVANGQMKTNAPPEMIVSNPRVNHSHVRM